ADGGIACLSCSFVLVCLCVTARRRSIPALDHFVLWSQSNVEATYEVKTMAELMKCSYCGRDMSPEFSECPHCGKVVPRPVVCCVCQQAMNSTEAILNKHVGLKRFLHPYSYKAVLEEQVCPVCKYVFTENEQSRRG